MGLGLVLRIMRGTSGYVYIYIYTHKYVYMHIHIHVYIYIDVLEDHS